MKKWWHHVSIGMNQAAYEMLVFKTASDLNAGGEGGGSGILDRRILVGGTVSMAEKLVASKDWSGVMRSGLRSLLNGDKDAASASNCSTLSNSSLSCCILKSGSTHHPCEKNPILCSAQPQNTKKHHKTSIFSFIVCLSFVFVILSFLPAKNGVLRSNKSFFVEKVRKMFIEKILRIHFHCILCRNFSKNFRFSKFLVNCAPKAPLLRSIGPKMWEHPPHPRGEKLGDDTQKSTTSGLA